MSEIEDPNSALYQVHQNLTFQELWNVATNLYGKDAAATWKQNFKAAKKDWLTLRMPELIKFIVKGPEELYLEKLTYPELWKIAQDRYGNPSEHDPSEHVTLHPDAKNAKGELIQFIVKGPKGMSGGQKKSKRSTKKPKRTVKKPRVVRKSTRRKSTRKKPRKPTRKKLSRKSRR